MIQSVKKKLIKFIGRMPSYAPKWSKPILRPLSGFYIHLYRGVYNSVREEAMVTTSQGLKLFVNYSDYVEREIANGTYERDYVNTFCQTVREGDTVLDVGANVGYFSLLASRKAGARGVIYAFEPAPKTYGRLLRNLRINQIENVVALELGLSDMEETLRLRIPKENPAEASIASQASSEVLIGTRYAVNLVEVKLMPFDKFYGERRMRGIDVVKIDVEGSELKVLRGMNMALRSNPNVILFVEISPLLIELLDGKTVELVHLLRECGFVDAFAVNKNIHIDLVGLDDQAIDAALGSLPDNYILRKNTKSGP